ncbi:halocyanin [Halostella sp. JP-L12]|uniref:plastocyanin/azurin family copper-binding protein n=1 Tax=Halostella TaxID=1843185 RepID=UPI000EF79DDE|nr:MULTISPECIES: plastocyanin/azurin family copper-binding protein [Halostella]NHN49540.1 halocyanin [Halostella sp. JP-L12]
MKRRTYLAGLSAAGATGLSGCLASIGSAGNACDGDCDVGMSAKDFTPQEYEVSVGTTVTWKNTSSKGHTVTAYDDGIPEGAEYFASGGYDSESEARDGWRSNEGLLTSGDTYEHTFEVAGEYDYVCLPHENGGMVGTIVVTE